MNFGIKNDALCFQLKTEIIANISTGVCQDTAQQTHVWDASNILTY